MTSSYCIEQHRKENTESSTLLTFLTSLLKRKKEKERKGKGKTGKLQECTLPRNTFTPLAHSEIVTVNLYKLLVFLSLIFKKKLFISCLYLNSKTP